MSERQVTAALDERVELSVLEMIRAGDVRGERFWRERDSLTVDDVLRQQ
jgi:hypothetical protein